MNSARLLIVNADDFGLHPAVNRGVILGHEQGIVTSASLMVRQPAAKAAADAVRVLPRLGLGLHVDLAEYEYRSGAWRATYEVVPPEDADAVAAEVARQLDAFRRLTGRDPTHLDSHQHVHRESPAREALVRAAQSLGVPLRHFDSRVRYCGAFYGQSATGDACHERVTADALLRVLQELPWGATELACHPAGESREDADEAELASPYRVERVMELRALCDPWVARAIRAAGITLATFADLGQSGDRTADVIA
jgi:predicted glycoside hydrolase/deacetylase ChbG (UPF0249 family)